ncbi:MAG: HEAT repeat domain-containing protein [Planctomycetales bacterium]|nr:HEAT repeat domain-containing protein [Planctomycetales bacterium]
MSTEPPRPEGLPELVYSRWSGDINVPDPVAISVADNGDVYVTQTQRRKIQDLDIREHSQWIPDDVGMASVEQKRAFYHKVMAIGGDQIESAKNVQDVNGDGSHDWRDLTVISEKIHRLVDSDGDGVADQINLFADDFRTEVTGIAAGVMHWDGSVWATIAPDVWKLTDVDGDGVSDRREIMATGFGMHIAYGGHDMHGLTIGPDGKIYWSIGDKGIAVTSKEGKVFNFPNQGGVMRCNPDGSDFEVYAHGLRNVQEFAFDQFGNWFGIDNDADKPDEKERFVWIVDQMDAGWRCNYQYRGDDYNPWTNEKLWQVAGPDHPAYIVPPIQNYVDGPAGFKFNPGGALSAKYKDYFFMTSAPNGFQYAFRTEPLGDSFRMINSHKIGEGDPIVGIAFGGDGGLYGVDWGGGYPLNQSGSVIRIDVPKDQLSDDDVKIRQEVAEWLAKGMKDQEVDVLVGLLSHVDQRIRLRAQFSLAARQKLEAFQGVLADENSHQLARVHSVWGLGQIIRSGGVSSEVLYRFLSDRDPIIRSVVAKTLGETGDADPEQLIKLLRDSELHVKIHAALAIARRPSEQATESLLEMAGDLQRDQHYLRHAIVTALAACAPAERLAEMTDDESDVARICAVLALRRQSNPLVASFLADPSDWVATEAARAIHDDRSIMAAMPELAESLEQSAERPSAMTRRSINANFRLGTRVASQRVLRFAADANRPEAMRLAACQAIGSWSSPPTLDLVDGRNRKTVDDRIIDIQLATSILTQLVQHSETEIRVAAVKASRQLKIRLSPEALATLSRDTDSPDTLRAEALQTLASAESTTNNDDLLATLVALVKDPSSLVASTAVRLLADLDAEAALKVIRNELRHVATPVRQACIASLAKLKQPDADDLLIELADQFVEGTLPSSVHLDVWMAIKSRADESDAISRRMMAIENTSELAKLESTKFREFAMSLSGGDAHRGEAIFRADVRAQCSRCHRIGKSGSDIGPELTKIAKQRDAKHLLRAIVYPSADIEPKYNTRSLLLADGNIVQGVIKSEDDKTTVLINSEGKEINIPSDEIEAVSDAKVSLMPDMTDVLSPAEVRDLVAYLSTLR